MSLFNDIAALAKAGWKPSDVKAIIELEQKKEESAKNEDQEIMQPVSKSEEKKEKSEELVDYKAKYEEAQAKLQKIYDENSRKEVITDEPSIDYIVSDIASKL